MVERADGRSLLVTGAGGRVGRQLLPGLAGHRVRLLDRTRPEPAPDAPPAAVVVGELSDSGVVAEAVAGVDVVVHLAGDPRPDAPWDDLRHSNVDGFVALLGAARAAGVQRVVFASSVHAMGRYEAAGRVPVDPGWAPAPCCAYGASKAFDEAIAGVYADRGGMSVIGLRLGATLPEPTTTSQLSGWLGPADLRRLVVAAIGADVRFGVYPGVSANTRNRWDLGSAAAELGYHPELDSEVYAGRVRDDRLDTTDLVTCPLPR